MERSLLSGSPLRWQGRRLAGGVRLNETLVQQNADHYGYFRGQVIYMRTAYKKQDRFSAKSLIRVRDCGIGKMAMRLEA
jgi:hypothetical protein